jgi:hypothetical protein
MQISDEMVEMAAEAIWHSEPARIGSRRMTLWLDEGDEMRERYRPLARAAIAAVLPMIRGAVVEEAAKWHENEARRWDTELWDRRSWGGPTIGGEECLAKMAAHKEAAAAIRAMKQRSAEGEISLSLVEVCELMVAQRAIKEFRK